MNLAAAGNGRTRVLRAEFKPLAWIAFMLGVFILAAIISFMAIPGRAAAETNATACSAISESDLRSAALTSEETDKLRLFLECYPNSPDFPAISKRLGQLTMKKECQLILGSDNVRSMKSFLQRNTSAPCVVDLARRIQELESIPDFKTYVNSMFSGTALARGTVRGVDECKRSCGPSRPGCKGYSYESEGKICTLWKDISGRIPRGKTESGSIGQVGLPSAGAPPPSRYRSLFVVKNDFDLPGGTFRTLRISSYSICERTCATDNLCAGFTYDTRKTSCELKEALRSAIPAAGRISGAKRTQPTQNTTGRMGPVLNNTDLPNYGNSAADYGQVFAQSVENCRAMCQRDRRCGAFTYNLAARTCFLKSSYERRIPFAGAYSGIKQ